MDRDLQRSLSSNEINILLGGEDLTAEIIAKRERRDVESCCVEESCKLPKTFHALV